jgi:hypothetical protein
LANFVFFIALKSNEHTGFKSARVRDNKKFYRP